MEEPESLAAKRAILEYWTLVEFFSPYILDNVLNNKQSYLKIYADEHSSEPLPWLKAPIIHENDPTTPFAKGYHLYLGLFSIEETADRARHTFTQNPSQWKSVNWQSCASDTTCFARLTLTTHGIPLFGTLTLSTLPWAHGRLLEGKEPSITIEHYWKNVNRLFLCLREEFSAHLPMKLMKKPNTQARHLDLQSLTRLNQLLYDWAGYCPLGYPLALIETLSGNETLIAKEPQIKTERDIPILNSFYIQDLEAVAISLNNLKGTPIDHYLGEEKANRIPLDTPNGEKIILDTIRPEKIPSGRWPDALSKKQSLMQQFAINAASESTLFSVNGPPGTGKTSLLREIIAHNVVARAKALSQFPSAKKAFTGRQTLNFENSDPIFVSELDPSLLGYEMVVVSSNNNAVQILSHELPLRSQLAPSFQQASYLETVATKALGAKEKEAWGLVSAALGNFENCRRFVENVFITPSEVKGQTRIWEWIDSYEGPSFAEARNAFIKIRNHQEGLAEALERLAFLHDEVSSHSDESYCSTEMGLLLDAEEKSELLHSAISQLTQEEVEHKEHLALLQEREMLWKGERPNLLTRALNRKSSKTWSDKFTTIKKERIAAIEELHKGKTDLKELRKQLLEQSEQENDLAEKLLDRALCFHLYKENYELLRKTYPTAHLPIENEELTQTESYYQTSELNEARSELFIAAMTLHEAWLAESLQAKGGFRGNLMAIANLLQGKLPTTTDDTLLVWQSLFLLIPVISSTFASIGRLFRHLEPGTLGWVFIDEAGQAVPQAAVGAIWRANQVLSIGDPFQIEPICTIPPEVVDGMAKIRIKDRDLAWAPSQISVQHLMDRTSLFGSMRTIGEACYWLGSPLRVHRRCLEPMFSIANTIAYESSMLLATPEWNDHSLPPSCWWDIGGPASDRQYVPNQGKALLHLLRNALLAMNPPDLFVISPFREVISQIKQLVVDDKSIADLIKQRLPLTSLPQWVQQAFGTVHIFQGKQTHAVFFVLGADKTTPGAVEWASGKPNLLNVAVTRARSRFYILGDYDLWKNRPYFNVVARKLERMSFPEPVAK